MKTLLCWFSGTGNSLWAARALADALGEAELAPMARTDPAELPQAERVGFVFPVYGFGPPRLVTRFLQQARLQEPRYVFAVMTYAGNPGSTGRMAGRSLTQCGNRFDAAFGIRMVENYPPFGGAPSQDKQKELLNLARQRIDAIAASVRQESQHFETGNALWNLAGPLIHRLFMGNLPRTDRKFTANEACNGCGVCRRVCPADNIKLVDERPVWQGNCEQCYACFHWCPQQSIQYGPRTARQLRYHHPDCKATDLMAPAHQATGS